MAHQASAKNNALRKSDGHVCKLPPGILRFGMGNNEVFAHGMLMFYNCHESLHPGF